MSESQGGDGGGTARRRRRSGARPAQAEAQATPQESEQAAAPAQADVTPERGKPGGGPAAKQRTGQPRRQRGESAGRDTGDRALRDLVGAGRSQLGVGGALRGRDVNRPTDEDLAAAERNVVIVRRNWKPPDQ